MFIVRIAILGCFFWMLTLVLGMFSDKSLCDGIGYDHECEMQALKSKADKDAKRALTHTLLR